jgi:hypothetical protein
VVGELEDASADRVGQIQVVAGVEREIVAERTVRQRIPRHQRPVGQGVAADVVAAAERGDAAGARQHAGVLVVGQNTGDVAIGRGGDHYAGVDLAGREPDDLPGSQAADVQSTVGAGIQALGKISVSRKLELVDLPRAVVGGGASARDHAPGQSGE